MGRSCTAKSGLAKALDENTAEKNIDKKAMAIVITGLGDSPLRATQECQSGKDAKHKLRIRYARKSTINEVSLLKNLLNSKLGRNTQISDHVS